MSESQIPLLLQSAAGLAVIVLIILVGAMLVAYQESRNCNEENQG